MNMTTKKITTLGMLCALAVIVNLLIHFPLIPSVEFLSYDAKDVIIVIGGFMTANERPVPAICISVGRGLVLQSAVLFALAVSFGGDAVWFTPIFSEFLCLVFSLRALKAYRRHPAGNRK